MDKIVYVSQTGHTKQYATILAEELNIPCYSIEEIEGNVSADDSILFMSWVMASTIRMYPEMKKKYNLSSVIAVGMSDANEANEEGLKTVNKIEVPFFYLQGGVDYTKLKGFKKLILKMVGKQVIKQNRPEDKQMILLFQEGGNFVSKEALAPIVSYYQSNKEKKNEV